VTAQCESSCVRACVRACVGRRWARHPCDQARPLGADRRLFYLQLSLIYNADNMAHFEYRALEGRALHLGGRCGPVRPLCARPVAPAPNGSREVYSYATERLLGSPPPKAHLRQRDSVTARAGEATAPLCDDQQDPCVGHPSRRRPCQRSVPSPHSWPAPARFLSAAFLPRVPDTNVEGFALRLWATC
jgi:hypothetical protein